MVAVGATFQQSIEHLHAKISECVIERGLLIRRAAANGFPTALERCDRRLAELAGALAKVTLAANADA